MRIREKSGAAFVWLAALSGPLNLVGAEQKRGFDIALEHLGNRLGGVPIELVTGDSKSNPGATVQELSRLIEPGVRERVVQGLKALGYRFVTLDLEGFRSGSLNVALKKPSPPLGERAG